MDFSQLGPLPVLGTLTTAEVSESVRSEVRRRMKMMGKRFEEEDGDEDLPAPRLFVLMGREDIYGWIQ